MTCEVAFGEKCFKLQIYEYWSHSLVCKLQYKCKPQTYVRSEIQVWGFPVPPQEVCPPEMSPTPAPHLVSKGLRWIVNDDGFGEVSAQDV